MHLNQQSFAEQHNRKIKWKEKSLSPLASFLKFLCAFQIENNDLIIQRFLSPKLGVSDDHIRCEPQTAFWSKGKAIPATGREGPKGCEKSRFPHFPDNRLTDGGKVVSLTRPPPFTPQKDSW
jgi:hypothetical protein